MTSSTTDTTQSVNVNPLIPAPLKNVVEAIYGCRVCHVQPESGYERNYDILRGNIFPPSTSECNCDQGLAARKVTIMQPRFKLAPFVND